jgi:hypothetical protein
MNPSTDSNGRNLTTADLARTGARGRAAEPDAQAAERTGRAADRPDDRAGRAPADAAGRAPNDAAGRAPVDTRSDGRSDTRADGRSGPKPDDARPDGRSEKLDALFTPEATREFRSQWTDIQARFVDDPRQAVRDGDELVARVMKSLAESFASERNRVESQLRDGGDASTELLRVALRRYRSFFERLLTL